MKLCHALVSAALLAAASQAFALTINPTFVDTAAGTWTTTEKAVVNKAIADWTGEITDTQTVNVTVDFTTAASYMGQWNGSRAVGVNTMPWQNTTHTIHFNADLLTPDSNGNYLWFDPTPSTDNDVPIQAWDALSVARHEIGHMLGFTDGFYLTNNGTLDRWTSHIVTVNGNPVFDPAGANVRMDSSGDLAHVYYDYASVRYLNDVWSNPPDLMAPTLYNSVRAGISQEDLSMLHSAYGYTLVPEPSLMLLLGASFGIMLIRPRHSQKA